MCAFVCAVCIQVTNCRHAEKAVSLFLIVLTESLNCMIAINMEMRKHMKPHHSGYIGLGNISIEGHVIVALCLWLCVSVCVCGGVCAHVCVIV